MKRRGIAIIMSGMLALTLAGCASNPEKSVVREKNMDKMLQEAEKTEDTSTYEQVKEEVQKYEKYKTQIKDKKYLESIAGYSGEVLLVGINYDRKTKIHSLLRITV